MVPLHTPPYVHRSLLRSSPTPGSRAARLRRDVMRICGATDSYAHLVADLVLLGVWGSAAERGWSPGEAVDRYCRALATGAIDPTPIRAAYQTARLPDPDSDRRIAHTRAVLRSLDQP